jgi:hypothetical protein
MAFAIEHKNIRISQNLGCKAFLFFFLLGLGYMFFYLDESRL